MSKNSKRNKKPITLTGTFQKNPRGFGFIQFDREFGDEFEDAFLPERVAARFTHGDRLRVKILPDGEVVSTEVMHHRLTKVIGRFGRASSAKPKFEVIYRRRNFEERFLATPTESKVELHTIDEGDWVKATIRYPTQGQHGIPTASIEAVLGKTLPAEYDVELICGEFDLKESFSPTVREEAKKQKDTSKRKDLREIPFITIDGEDARDFDDAIFVEKEGERFILWVGIADVSAYVTPGSSMDKEAYQRATSVYFPERALHMLPPELSEGLCSLRPNEDKLSLVARLRMSPQGKLEKTELIQATIRSRRRATYTEIAKEYQDNSSNESWEYYHFFELYHLLRRNRDRRGSFDLELEEKKIEIDPVTKEPIRIYGVERNDAHRLIEEFMIAANEAVTEWMDHRKIPFLYRVHPEPSERKIKEFFQFLKGIGVTFSKNLALKTLIDDAKKHPLQRFIHYAFLRSLKQAFYSASNLFHFGLASRHYTHFTSPIRRYPDLAVHRLLKSAVEGGRRAQKPEIERIADHSSYRERLASEAEREMHRLKKVRFAAKHLGFEGEGMIQSVNKRGVIVDLPSLQIDGFLPADSFSEELRFDEKASVWVGKKIRLRLGGTIGVRLVRTDFETRDILFAPLEHGFHPTRHKSPN